MGSSGLDAQPCRVSLVVPLRNEEAFVGRCLDSVLDQLQGREDVEILCVDGASTDKTRDILCEYAANDERIQVIDNPGRIVPAAMNLAIARARGAVIIRLDGHARYAPDYIAKCLDVLERTQADVVGGYMTTLPGGDTPAGRAIAAASSSPFGAGGSTFRTDGPERETDAIPFGCFRREVFDKYGLFDVRLARNQDIELYSRIRRGGGRVVVSPEIKLSYYNRATFAGLREQSFTNGLWNCYTLYVVGGGLSLRHFVPLAFVSAILVLGAAGFLWPMSWLLLTITLSVYCIAAFAAAWGAAANSSASVFMVFLTLVQLHLSYGFGSLAGLLAAPIKFRGTNKRRCE